MEMSVDTYLVVILQALVFFVKDLEGERVPIGGLTLVL